MKHKTGKDKLVSKETKERDIVRLLREGDVTHPVGETLPMDQRVYRVKVLKCFTCGYSHCKDGVFQLKENSFCLSDCRHMSDLILYLSRKSKLILEKSCLVGPYLLCLMALHV